MRLMTTASVIFMIAFIDMARTVEEPRLCQAGMYMDKKGGCVQCPVGTYTPVPNTYTRCIQHTQCDVENMISSLGTATHDTVCTCLPGYHWDDETETCMRNLYCPPGEGIANDGRACTECINGTYSDELSNIEPCILWTDCSSFGLAVISEGTPESDRVCSGQNPTDTRTTITSAIAGNNLSSKDKGENKERQRLTYSTPGAMEVSLIAMSAVAVWGICILLAWKVHKHLPRKTRTPEVQLTDQTAEEAILVNEASIDKVEGAHYGVACEDDSLPTHPKEKEFYSSGEEHSQRLLHSGSDISPPFQDSGYENTGSECLDDEELATGREGRWERSNARMIPQVFTVDYALSPVASTTASSVQTSPSSIDYREGAQRLVLGAYSNVVTARVVEILAVEFQDCKYLGHGLGLKQYEIDRIINEHRDDIKQQIFAMLCNWQQGKTGDATISDLEETLLACNRLELLSRLQSVNDHAVT